MTLGGTIFGYNVVSQDYSYEAAIQSLKDACDFVIVLDAGSTDNSQEELKKFEDDKCRVVLLDGQEWKEQKGKEKLAYFTNRALDLLPEVDWHLNVQMDEVIHEDSIPFIRQAIEYAEVDRFAQPFPEGFLCRRHHLWRDPYSMLNVVQSRKPASTEIVRLARPSHRSVGDGEGLECAPFNLEFLDKIELFHTGYVRDPYIMKKKVIHMLNEVFLMDTDKKLDLSDKYEWWHYFNESDLIPIRKPLPKYMTKWAQQRYPHLKPPIFK